MHVTQQKRKKEKKEGGIYIWDSVTRVALVGGGGRGEI